jgi:hypothetical protein
MIEEHILTSDQKLEVWENGEWVEEADRYEWEYKGLKCEVLRHIHQDGDFISGMGHLNGYVTLPKGHPWEDHEYDDIDVEVHGGLTFGQRDKDGITLIGFDAAHLYDETPSSTEKVYRYLMKKVMEKVGKESSEYLDLSQSYEKIISISAKFADHHSMDSYKNFAFMKRECESLADQVLAAIVI